MAHRLIFGAALGKVALPPHGEVTTFTPHQAGHYVSGPVSHETAIATAAGVPGFRHEEYEDESVPNAGYDALLKQALDLTPIERCLLRDALDQSINELIGTIDLPEGDELTPGAITAQTHTNPIFEADHTEAFSAHAEKLVRQVYLGDKIRNRPKVK